MAVSRRGFLASAGLGAASLALAACSGDDGGSSASTSERASSSSASAQPEVDLAEFSELAIDMDSWRYDDTNDVYFQLGVPYCLDPASETYESLSLYVPGGYLAGERHGRLYSCELVEDAIVGRFTPETAPVLVPVNTGELSPQACPTKYSFRGLRPFLSAGCVYCYPGLRGRSAGFDSEGDGVFAGGSPWPVVDLKAVVRYLRYNAAELPFDPDRIFVFGFSAGGGAAATVGASGGSALFEPYLADIGAATHDADGNPLTDAVAGVALWNPKTSFDVADAAYEWERGQWSHTDARADGSWTGLLSRDLAAAYGTWVGEAGLVDADGASLYLDQTDSSVYGAGSYADALLAQVEAAATDFLSTTQFPYTETPLSVEDPSFPGDPSRAAEATEEEEDEQGEAGAADASTGAETAAADASTGAGTAAADASTDAGQSDAGTSDASASQDAAMTDASGSAADASTSAAGAGSSQDATQTDVVSDGTAGDGSTTPGVVVVTTTTATTGAGVPVQSTVYNSADDYVASLNLGMSYPWIVHNQTQDTVSVASLGQFFATMSPATLGVGATDDVDRSGTANQLFGLTEDDTSVHFSEQIRDCLRERRDAYEQASGWSVTYNTAWMHDLRLTDDHDEDVPARVQLMNPLYWVAPSYEGYENATVAPSWRICSGLSDAQVPLACGYNLSLALSALDAVDEVTYVPVWGQGHVLAERSGTPAANLVDWVVSVVAK